MGKELATIHYLIIDYPTCGHVLAVAIYSLHVEKNEICDDSHWDFWIQNVHFF